MVVVSFTTVSFGFTSVFTVSVVFFTCPGSSVTSVVVSLRISVVLDMVSEFICYKLIGQQRLSRGSSLVPASSLVLTCSSGSNGAVPAYR